MADINMTINIILASSSPRRKELLEQVGIHFTTCKPDIDETIFSDENIKSYAIRMAENKAKKGYEISIKKSKVNNEKLLIIGSDTCAEINGEMLGKPTDLADATRILKKLSGKIHIIHTTYALYDGSRIQSNLVSSLVSFKNITDKEITDYWNTGEPCDKAGAYAIQGIGAKFVSNLSGSYSAVMGLPLFELVESLEHFNKNND